MELAIASTRAAGSRLSFIEKLGVLSIDRVESRRGTLDLIWGSDVYLSGGIYLSSAIYY